jgi:hypothetical protein
LEKNIISMEIVEIVETINRNLQHLGCPASTLAGLAGISGGRLSNYLNGVQPVANDDDRKLRQALAGLKKLIAAAQPLPIDFRRVGELRELISALENGGLEIFVLARPGAVRTLRFVVIFGDGNFFAGLDRYGRLVRSLNEGPKFGVPVMDEDTADRVVDALGNLGHQGISARAATVYNDDTPIQDNFDQVWKPGY